MVDFEPGEVKLCSREKSVETKTEYMCVNERATGRKVKMQGVERVKVYDFKYLWSAIQNNTQ